MFNKLLAHSLASACSDVSGAKRNNIQILRKILEFYTYQKQITLYIKKAKIAKNNQI